LRSKLQDDGIKSLRVVVGSPQVLTFLVASRPLIAEIVPVPST